MSNEAGIKYDDNKPLVGTMLDVFPHALMSIGALIKFGMSKYPSPDNWQRVENAQIRYKDALMRHLLKHCAGEIIDPETKMYHLVSVCWNALAILELYIRSKNETRDV